MRILLRIDPLQLQKADQEIGDMTTPTYKLMIVCFSALVFFGVCLGMTTAWLLIFLGLGHWSILAPAGIVAMLSLVMLCKPNWFTSLVKR